ncbi:DUF2235 domain-containing protein, partial [Burkholderia thailandensis]|nr:DUF2235 domain-containing protein [Burkholderia thailandensis]
LWGFLRWRTVFVNGVRWDQPRVPTVQEEMEGMRMQMQRQVDMKGIGVLFQ